MADEFPADMVARCEQAFGAADNLHDGVIAILRASGHGNLTASMQLLRPYMAGTSNANLVNAWKFADGALAIAGYPQGSP